MDSYAVRWIAAILVGLGLGGAGCTAIAPADQPGSAELVAGASDARAPAPWLYTQGNHIYREGAVWYGRGASFFDTRSCNACAYQPPNVAESLRRMDALMDVWHANFIRINLESYRQSHEDPQDPVRVHYKGVLDDPGYFRDVKRLVEHARTRPGVYVLLSLWVDPSFTPLGWPSEDTRREWRALAAAFRDTPHVLFGVVNEPQSNFDGEQDAEVWTEMNDTVAAIREVEDQQGSPHHVVVVQGTRAWARRLDYYLDHPILAGGGSNVAYETHIYNPSSDFGPLLEDPARRLPVIIGEFAPTDEQGARMTLDDTNDLMLRAEQLEVPYLAWSFHMRCGPSLLVDALRQGCEVGLPLTATPWGQQVKARLSAPYGR